MAGEPITYFNRYAGELQQEAVYGERALRLVYETLPGRALAWMFVAHPAFSRLYGRAMRRPRSAARIRPFVKQYGINTDEMAEPLEAYPSFNAFFKRLLKEEARPVDADPATVVFPADGRHMGWPRIGQEAGIFVKGQRWDLAALLGDPALAQRFAGGTLVLSRLCPVDYHHFHYPVGGIVGEPRWLGRRLYSVSPVALRRRVAYLWENKRSLTLIRTERLGLVLFMEIGATNVGTIRHRPLPESRRVAKGDRKGWFEFGGSSVLTLFEAGRVQLATDLLEQSARGIELYAQVGDRMGKACP